MLSSIINSALIIFAYMTILFIISIIKKDNSIADIGWGIGFIIVAVFNTVYKNSLITTREIILLSMIAFWGMRLAGHIFFRNKDKKEDFRYAKWRKRWGKLFYIRSYFQVFILQGVLMLVISLPIFVVINYDLKGISILDIIAILIWLAGFLFEAISDYQLHDFIKNRKTENNNIMTEGLWQYSRHPNYFGEALLWWGPFLLCLNFETGILAIFSPMTIDYLIMFVSGVPILEKRFMKNPEYRKYAEKTNRFFPWFSKKN
ncbi:MAG: DUF1295 domain-containing protein [Candidatus Mcinerneyibacterium aminivorans]|uniref:DUF1295 domain-containing protein n=1 Tax=Candidatus Mcinerneyibacterium aminivorans TaxID=2703815 RepID=A0A5D0MDP4_9BACT|nr:MAG: DUF1295 domain-containing protein [Candidatus Mcinerneyibacterium aminivorans]